MTTAFALAPEEEAAEIPIWVTLPNGSRACELPAFVWSDWRHPPVCLLPALYGLEHLF